MWNKTRGFTLIELMIVIVVVAILVAIAIPSYRHYVLRTHRVEAKRALLGVAAAQERFYLQHNTYAGPSALDTAPPGGLGIADTTERGYYAVAITAGGVSAFSATATAQGGQAHDSRCITFTIDQAGSRTATSPNCWD